MAVQQKESSGLIVGRGERHLLDDIAGMFRKQHIDGQHRFVWIQYPLLAATFVLVVASIVGAGVTTYKIARNPSRIFSNLSTRQSEQGATGQPPATELPQVADPTSAARIGVVGCSNTRQHAEGYDKASEAGKLWPYREVLISGGTIKAWGEDISDSNSYWSNFQANFNKYGADVVWFQMCIRAESASASGMTAEQQGWVKTIISEIGRRTSNTTIYISPLNHYVINDCSATGPYGQLNSIELADWAVAQGLASRGPNTGPLSHSQLVSDFCHLNGAGIDLVGEQMVNFFDLGDTPPPPPNPGPDPTPTPDPDPNPAPNANDCNLVVSMSQGRQVYQGKAASSLDAEESPLEEKTGEQWMLLFKSGKRLAWWTDANNWTGLGERNRCGSDAEIDQVVFIFDPAGSPDMVADLNKVKDIVKSRYPSAEIDLSLLVGSVNHVVCQALNASGQLQNVHASSTHAAHIAKMTMPEAGADMDVACNDYADRIGHLTDAGAASANQQLADFLTP